MAHIHIQGLDATANSVIDSLESLETSSSFVSETPYCLHYRSGGTGYKLPLVQNGTCTKDGVSYRYNSNRKTIHVICDGNKLHVPNEKMETIKFNVTLRFDNTYVSGSSGSYDQCGDVYGWVSATYDNKVTASVTASKTISSWSIRLNGNLEAWIEGWNQSSSHQTLLSSGSTLTSSSPASSVKRQYFYTITDYQDSGSIYRLFHNSGTYTITINFTDGTSITKTFSIGWAKSDYGYFGYNQTLYGSSGEITA